MKYIYIYDYINKINNNIYIYLKTSNMIAQHMIRSYTHKIWCHVVMKCYKHQIKYIRHCFPLPTPGLTPVPSRSDAPATWPPSFLRDLAGF